MSSQLLAWLPAAAENCFATRPGRGPKENGRRARGGVDGRAGPKVTYCSKLTTEEAREVDKALSGLDPEPRQGARLSYRLAEPVNNLNPTRIWFEPYFPHGQVTCSACG